MNFFKKAAIFCLSLTCCLTLGFAIGCGDEGSISSSDQSATSSSDGTASSDSANDEEPAYLYRVSIENPTGFGLRDVTVSLFDGETRIAQASTNVSGYAYFIDSEDEPIALGNYTVKIDELPAGYTYLNADATYSTVALAETTVKIPLAPTGVMSGHPVAGSVYKLGDVMYDFTAITSDNSTWTLSEVLKDKQLVVINFWATWCGPCLSEFPVMNKVLTAYTSSVDCLAISTTDSKDAVASFKTQGNYGFDMASVGAGNNLAGSFAAGSNIPQTILIDRYGGVVFNHIGAITSQSDWEMLFDTYVGDDYQSTIWGENDNDNGNTEGGDSPSYIEPTVPAPSYSDVHEALGTTEQEFEYRWQAKGVLSKDDHNYDPYSWPWLVKSDTDENGQTYSYLAAGNTVVPTDDGSTTSLDYSYATLYVDIKAKAGDVLVFDYKVGTETNCDILYVIIDKVPVVKLSGYQYEEWNTCYAYVFTAESEGEHEVGLLFNKDSDKSAYGDIVQIKNLRMETTADGIMDAENAHIFRYAATDPNTDENATTQFKNYITPVFNEEDGYYHVNKVDGPILFADLWYTTQWSNMSVWMLAYNDYCVMDGFNYKPFFEQYAWEGNNNIIGDIYAHGLVCVTEELRTLLELATQVVPYKAEWDNFDGEWHENEWLEICCYYEPYGNTPQLEDPLKTITFHAAAPVYEGDNHIEVPFAINPRGFKYKFTPTTSGVYKVFSTGSADPVTFLVASDRTTFLGEWNNKLIADSWEDENGNVVSDGNFEYYWYFEAGETYYMLFTSFLDQACTYNVTIQHIGDSYTYLNNMATMPYSANLVTGELFIPNALDYVYDKDYVYDEALNAYDPTLGIGCYRYVDEHGNMGSPIYLDMWHPTSFSDRISLYDQALADSKVADVNKRQLCINGVDYTDFVLSLGYQSSMNSGIYFGYTIVTQEVYEFLYALTVHSAHQGISDSWLTLCYYEHTVQAP